MKSLFGKNYKHHLKKKLIAVHYSPQRDLNPKHILSKKL